MSCLSAPRCYRIVSTDLTPYRLLEQGLTDGGTAGLIWGFVIVAVGFLFVFLSLAEMASMYVLNFSSKIFFLGHLLMHHAGLQHLEGNTIGYRNLHREAVRNSSATLLVWICIYSTPCSLADSTRLALCYGMAVCHCLYYFSCGNHYPRSSRAQ